MIKIGYPPSKPLIRQEEKREAIFCMCRKKWVMLTPEEWVRQNFLQYLAHVLHYPVSLIAVEKQLLISETKKRFDIVVYDRGTKPFMIVECKEMNVELTPAVLHQVLHYNIKVQAEYTIVTNGSYCIAYRKKDGRMELVDSIPEFSA